ncbi:hypothetical protein [Serinicoccus sp. LYQ131]|uniref:hypothetical protein n=1 Tax=Serinicoccus sp. LYQ131 TaxID=3378797 RepID=UPI0038553E47
MTQAREPKAKAATRRFGGQSNLVVCIVTLILSGFYWFQVITRDASWYTWAGAIGFLLMSVIWLVIDRQERRAAQRHRDDLHP